MEHQPSTSPAQWLRDVMARNAALRQYAIDHDRFSEQEQMHRLLGNWAEAEAAHWNALLVLRAYRADVDDPEPRG